MKSLTTNPAFHLIEQISDLELDTSKSGLACAETDFGGLSRGNALGIVRPANLRCVAEIIGIARTHGLKLTVRGKGLSQSGQAVADDSLLIDMSRCDAVGMVDEAAQTIVCEAGATWRSVVAKAAASGLGPKVIPLNLDLSVGGTLSAGGFGSSSHRHGVAVSHVASAEVALGSGEIVRCGLSERRPVFDAVLGGVGRCGVILRTELHLVSVPKKIRTFCLLYEDLNLLLTDQKKVASTGRASHIEAFCSASIQGFRRGAGNQRQPLVHWLYGLHLGVGFEIDPPAPETELKGLNFNRLLHVEDDEYLEHAARYDGRFQMMRLTGAWDQIHPWFEALLPAAAAPTVIAHALSALPMFFGDGHRILLIADTDRPASLAFPSDGDAIGFTVLPTGIPSVFQDGALAALKQLDDVVRQAGGRRYPSGWMFRTDPDAWKEHYRGSYPALLKAKREYDPDAVFQSCLDGLLSRQSRASDIPSH